MPLPISEDNVLDMNTLKENPLCVVLASKTSLQWLIEFGHKGVLFMDSSSRHKTNCNAPVTAVMVTNEQGQGLVGAMIVTSDIKAETIALCLNQLIKKIQEEAKALLLKQSQWYSNEFPAALVEESASAWAPQMAMIDKSTSELNALHLVFGESFYVRLCEFHVQQALNRMTCDNPKEKFR